MWSRWSGKLNLAGDNNSEKCSGCLLTVKKGGNRIMKKTMFVVLCVILCLACTLASAAAWTCPNCGRQGNEENFCPSCAAARPQSGFGTVNGNVPSVGSVVTFGTYPQRASGRDHTPIEWIVLDTSGSEVMLISRYSLDCQPYNRTFAYVTWETCSLRSWLNNTFYYTAFDFDEQMSILETHVMNGRNHCRQGARWRSDGGNDTYDKVFLLSYKECGIYFSHDASRMCGPTDYANTMGAYRDNDTGCGGWWQRSPAYEDKENLDAAFVRADGRKDGSRTVNKNTLGIRPVIWVDANSGCF